MDTYWLRLVRRYLREGNRHKETETKFVYHYITREGYLIRKTIERLDPEIFAREHISAEVIPISRT